MSAGNGAQLMNALHSRPGSTPSPTDDEPAAKQQRLGQERLYRVGLQQRCGKCGQPRKGHICPAEPNGQVPSGQAPAAPTMMAWRNHDGPGPAGKEGDDYAVMLLGGMSKSSILEWAQLLGAESPVPAAPGFLLLRQAEPPHAAA